MQLIATLPLATWNLGHAKRIRKYPVQREEKAIILQVILCPLDECAPAPEASDATADDTSLTNIPESFPLRPDGSFSPPGGAPSLLPQSILQLLREHDCLSAPLSLASVARNPPRSRDQQRDWSAVWPLLNRSPQPVPGSSDDLGRTVDAASVSRFMTRTRRLAAAASPLAGNACVIVDPASGDVMGEAADASAEHLLRHAVMEAIQKVAERDLKLWPPDPDNPVMPCAGPPKEDGPHRLSGGEAGPSVKRQKTESRSESGEEGRACSDGIDDTGGDRAGSSKGASVSGDSRNGGVKRKRASRGGKAHIVDKSYLCTGFDAYIWREPCAMCAMGECRGALVFFLPRP